MNTSEPVAPAVNRLPSLPRNGNGSNEEPQAKESTPDPFDPASLRISQDFSAGLGVKKMLLTVPVRKPSREWFVRVHPDESYRLQTGLLELKEERELYLVAPDLWSDLATEATFSPRALFTAISRQGTLFLWPIRLPGPDGRVDDWNRSALEASQIATRKWVRVSANMSLGAYDVYAASGNLPEPDWPEMPFSEILRTAFKDRYIQEPDHPVLRRLRGEI